MCCSLIVLHARMLVANLLICSMRSQHIFKHACKYGQDSREEAELTVGTLNSKLDDLSCTSDKVRRPHVCCLVESCLLSGVYAVLLPGIHIHILDVAGVSKVSADLAHAAHDCSRHALDRMYHHQRLEGAFLSFA